MTTIHTDPDWIGDLGPGDVLAVHGDNFPDRAIRFGAGLIDIPNLSNHIAVLDHKDAQGTWWCIEGRPGGVGWRDASAYLYSPYIIANVHQAKTIQQRATIVTKMQSILGVGYDWEAIFEDGLRDVHIPDPWGERWNGEQAGHVVCSSAAVLAYATAKPLGYPTDIDQAHVQPGDWDKFIIDGKYY